MVVYSSDMLSQKEKRDILINYFIKYQLKIFVETGTYIGATVKAMSSIAEKIYSIELDKKLYRTASKMFYGNDKINILNGDSSDILKKIIPLINKPAMFWLDAHWSGENTAWGKKKTPVLEEVKIILESPCLKHVMIIDDARFFGKDDCYPRARDIWYMVKRKGII